MPADRDSKNVTELPDIAPTEQWRRGRRESHDMAVVARIDGEIDMATAGLLDARIAAAERIASPAVPVVVDLTDVDFMDATGLRVLVAHHQRCVANRVVLAVVASGRPVLMPLRITALDSYLRLYPSLATAVAAELA
jgi:anti-anti-sigma factor